MPKKNTKNTKEPKEKTIKKKTIVISEPKEIAGLLCIETLMKGLLGINELFYVYIDREDPDMKINSIESCNGEIVDKKLMKENNPNHSIWSKERRRNKWNVFR